jgi:hypothetical protein
MHRNRFWWDLHRLQAICRRHGGVLDADWGFKVEKREGGKLGKSWQRLRPSKAVGKCVPRCTAYQVGGTR